MTTYSRYDFMKEGLAQDEVIGSNYPDPLSINYHNIQPTTAIKDRLTESKIMTFWKEVYDIYGVCGYDDIILTINGVPHKNLLETGDIIYFPDKEYLISKLK